MGWNQNSCHIILVESFLITGYLKNRIYLFTIIQYCKMAERSNLADAETLSDHSEVSYFSCSGYNTAYN